MRARYYDPEVGRFITEDSYWGKDNDPLSLNLYTYCQNDPIDYFDPTGHLVSNGSDFSYILNRPDSSYQYYLTQIERYVRSKNLAFASDYAISIADGAKNGFESYGGVLNEYTAITALMGGVEGAFKAASGSGMSDVIADDLAKLYDAFDNLGDKAYRMTSAQGRKEVIEEMNQYINQKKNDLYYLNQNINKLIQLRKEILAKTQAEYASGNISKKQYNNEMDTCNDYQNKIDNLQKYYKKLQVQYKPLIEDANTIIKVNE